MRYTTGEEEPWCTCDQHGKNELTADLAEADLTGADVAKTKLAGFIRS